MNKQDLFELVVEHSVNSGDYVPDYNYEKLVEAIFNATYPVGSHHDHMCPCGRDWETDTMKFKRLLKEYREKHVWSIPEGEIERICDWLDEQKNNG